MPRISDMNKFIYSEGEIPEEYRSIIDERSFDDNETIFEGDITPGEMGDMIIETDILKRIFSDDSQIYFGHGTNVEDMGMDSIFRTGLKVKNPEKVRGYFSHLIGLDSTTIQFGRGAEDLFDKEKAQLDNWPHLNARKIVICSLPIDFIFDPNHSIFIADLYNAFYVGSEEKGFSLRPEFIRGVYDANSHSMTLNKNFYKNLPTEEQSKLMQEISDSYIKGYAKFANCPPQKNPSFPAEKIDMDKASIEWYYEQAKNLRKEKESDIKYDPSKDFDNTTIDNSEIIWEEREF